MKPLHYINGYTFTKSEEKKKEQVKWSSFVSLNSFVWIGQA